MIVELAHVKEHLNISSNVDDALLTRQIGAAETHINRLLGFKMDAEFPNDTVPDDLKLAVCQLIAHWYENRESTLVGVSAQEIPFGVREIVREYRNWSF